MSQPNFLFIISDQHAPQVTGCYGAEFVRTPNLDRLAAEGTTFDAAYCNHPHCVPSRAGLMTGLETHRIPCYDFLSSYPSGLPTWAHMLSRAGYRTEMNGKMHFMGPDQLHGFHTHINEPTHKLGGFRWGQEQPDPANGIRYWADLHHEGDPTYETRTASELDKVADAVKFLHQSARREEPFCLTVGFFGPHYPQICDKAMFDAYADAAVPSPKPDRTLNARNQNWKRVWGFDRFTDTDTDNGRRAYLAMVSHLDDWIGRILHALEASGQAENTIVIYSSDHGEMWGEHGIWGKQCFYEESSRVPLIVRGPEFGVQAGQRVATPVTLLDLYPSFREFAGCRDWEVPLDGRSLVPALRGEALPEVPVFSEYYGPDTKGPERMVRYGKHKLNYYHNQPGETELFDLEADSGEMQNLADAPEHAETQARLMGMLSQGWDAEQLDEAVRVDQNRRTLIAESYG